MKKLSLTPKSPRHFVALCFMEMKHIPELRDSHQFMKLVKEEAHRALFECAYGFFWAAKAGGKYSMSFYKSKEEAIIKTSPLDIPASTLAEWTWEA